MREAAGGAVWQGPHGGTPVTRRSLPFPDLEPRSYFTSWPSQWYFTKEADMTTETSDSYQVTRLRLKVGRNRTEGKPNGLTLEPRPPTTSLFTG